MIIPIYKTNRDGEEIEVMPSDTAQSMGCGSVSFRPAESQTNAEQAGESDDPLAGKQIKGAETQGGAVQIFPLTSFFNVPVNTLPLVSNSAAMIAQMVTATDNHVHLDESVQRRETALKIEGNNGGKGRKIWTERPIARLKDALDVCAVIEDAWDEYPAQLVLQDVLTLHGSQFRNADVIVASPPCQAYSYRAMPWKRAKALPPPSNELFDACFRIQREASEAAGRYIPLVVENVKGGRSRGLAGRNGTLVRTTFGAMCPR